MVSLARLQKYICSWGPSGKDHRENSNLFFLYVMNTKYTKTDFAFGPILISVPISTILLSIALCGK